MKRIFFKMEYTMIFLQVLSVIQLMFPAAFNEIVRLSPSVAEVVENENVTIICSYNGTEQQTSSWWIKSTAINLNPTIFISHGICSASGYFTIDELYDWKCLGNSTFALTLKKVGRNQHGEKWKCIQHYVQSNEIEIIVKVPLQYVHTSTMNISTITRLENSTVQFTCMTSYSRPAPAITWFLDAGTTNQTNDDIISYGNKTQNNITNDRGLVSMTSTIRLSINRSVNGWSIYCLGSNIQNRKSLISKATKLNIIYPPDGPPAIAGYSNGSIYTVIEGQMGILSCSVTGGNPLAELAWYCYGRSVTLDKSDKNNQIMVSWIASRDQNGSCKCMSKHNTTENVSVSVDINVLYPPSIPELSIAFVRVNEIINVIVNNSLSINCTSNSNPKPKYTWTAPDSSLSQGQLLHIGNITEAGKVTYSCSAENHMFPSKRDNVTGSNTTSIDINVLFPPSVPVFRYGNINGIVITKNYLDVVENDTFTVACSSTANPEPKLWWSGETTRHSILTISSISADFNKTCYATNTMNETIGESRIGSSEAIISVRVLYPARKPIVTYFNSEGHERNCSSFNLSVVEKTSFSLSCTAFSEPKPSYSWYGPITSKIANLRIVSINRAQKGEYSCNAFNAMIRTFGSSQGGKNTQEIYLNVLYPPSVGHVSNQTVLEGSPFNISCPVHSGNPGQSIIIWTRNGDTKQWHNQTLRIRKTHREDDMIYTCTAYNHMLPSCENEIKGEASQSFHLNIVYRASVKRFYVNGLVGQSEVTVNENDSLEFSCLTESNPKSLINIGFNEKILISKSNVNTLTYTNITATCFHDGVYKCFGSNTYSNEEASVKHVTLRVNCFPRPSPNVQVRDKIYSTEHVTDTLSFKALAYPVPDESSFKWQRQIGLMWSTLANSKQIKIITSGLQTNLTIVNVTKSDFGKYRLFIENAIGIYEQIFYLAAKAPPDKPSEFKVIEGETTDTSVTLKWKPGSNHGSVQHFILQYKKVTDDEWISVNITDSNSSTINYTIKGLMSVTRYKVNIIAMSNLGRSDNLFIVFQTKGKPLTPREIEIIPESVRETSVTLQWIPGSDGGAPQKFVIKYSKIVDNEWRNISIFETDDQLQRQTINNLSSGSQYKLAILSSNRFGSSAESKAITFQTKDTTPDKPEEESSSFIGLLTGLSVSTIFHIIFIILVIHFWKRRVVRGHIKVPGKAAKELTVLRASYHSFIDQAGTCNSGAYEDMKSQASGQELTEVSKSYTPLDKQTGQVKRNISEGNLVLYEEIKVPGCGEESLQKKGRDGNKGKNDSRKHTNPTDYMNLEELASKS